MYVAPDGSYSAVYPSPWRRAAAAAIDWVVAYLAFLITSIVAGVFQAIGLTTWTPSDLHRVPETILLRFSQVLLVVPIVGYFAFYWTTGSTLGMRALDIELVAPETGTPPGRGRALTRACAAFVLAFATNNVYLLVASEPLESYATLQRILIGVSIGLFGVGLVAKAWMFLDARRQTLLDKLFGLLYVEEVVFSQETRWPWTTSGRLQ